MAKKTTSRKRQKTKRREPLGLRVFLRWIGRVFIWSVVAAIALVFLFAFVNPPSGIYMTSERLRLGGIKREWIPIESVSPEVARAMVAAEDADFCLHFGFDVRAIRSVVAGGEGTLRGASTITQQVSRNVFLWLGRSWVRKGLEAGVTVLVETLWSKKRIIEVYMNVAELDEGVFGVGAAGPHYFGVNAANLSALQAARLAAVLPNPKDRSASKPSNFTRSRTRSIMDGAATIAKDGRADCFQ